MAYYYEEREILNDLKDETYKELFDFFKNIMHVLQNFNFVEKLKVKNLNGIFGVIQKIEKKKSKIKLEDKNLAQNFFHVTKNAKNDVLVLNSNVPFMTLLNFYQNYLEHQGEMMKSKNLFISIETLENDAIFNNFKEVLQKKLPNNEQNEINCNASSSEAMIVDQEESELSNSSYENKNIQIFIECTSYDPKVYTNIFEFIKNQKIAFIVKNENLSQLIEIFNNLNVQPEVQNINHVFRNEKVQLSRLLSLQQAQNVIDTDMLNLLLEKSRIVINSLSLQNDENFHILYFSRVILKKINKKEDKFLDESEYIMQKKLKKFINVKVLKLNQENKYEVTQITTEVINMSQKEFLSDIYAQKYVLISDRAGNSKSWFLKRISLKLKEKYPYCWFDLINLKEFTEEFKKIDDNINFKEFYPEHILKNIFILFDGFDEISPNYANKVKSLISSYKYNNGNQLWITTRNNFEIELQDDLGLLSVYSLKSLTISECAELIAHLWTINSNEENFYDHLQNAQNLLRDINIINSSSIGLPQLLAMIAEIYSDYKSDSKRAKMEISLYSCYNMLVEMHIQKWIDNSPLRKLQSVKAQNNILRFAEIHQFYAMQYLFEKNNFCGLEEDKAWIQEEIVGCGLAYFKNYQIYFNHETFLEFFVASFIDKMIRTKQWKNHKVEFFDYFIKIFSESENYVVRSFLNYQISDTFGLIDDEIKKLHEGFRREICSRFQIVAAILRNIFAENLENCFDFILQAYEVNLDNLHNETIKEDLDLNLNIFTYCGFIGYSNIFEKFLNFFFDKLTEEKLKTFLMKHKTLNEFSKSYYNFDIFESLLMKIDKKFSNTESKIEILMLNNERKENIFHTICSNKYEKLFYFYQEMRNIYDKETRLKKFSSYFEILTRNNLEVANLKEMLLSKNRIKMTLLYQLVHLDDTSLLKFVYKKIEEILSPEEMNSFIQNISHRDQNRNFLQISLFFSSEEIQEEIWSLISDRNNLFEIVTQKESFDNSYICSLVTFGNLNFIKCVFEKLKEKLENKKFNTVLESKGYHKRNLIQKAVDKQKRIEVHEFLWDLIYEYCNSTENFLQFLRQLDNKNDTTMHTIVAFSTAPVLQFALKYFKKLNLTNEKIKEILSWKNERDFKNLLQTAAMLNKSIKLHETLWNIREIYLTNNEIKSMIKQKDSYRCYLFFVTVGYNNEEIVKFTWEKIKQYFNTPEEQKSYLKLRGFKGNTLVNNAKNVNKRNINVSVWVENLMNEYEIL
ncbi:hypothetical protein PVAND_014518 [Polypedilum vanderplanki]|uniref:NACHT domain-containing protein n=1 Tax=Polypedilum vanderplanki TaxID=319348 RepID=A0A9J6BA51_POLVA|nr:hypothetical protein PVAND_014518 [Polypedilum vanderplanki]